jgi:hypothetical protein
LEVSRRCGLLYEAERATDAAMEPVNIRVEVKNEKGRWVEESSEVEDAR